METKLLVGALSTYGHAASVVQAGSRRCRPYGLRPASTTGGMMASALIAGPARQ